MALEAIMFNPADNTAVALTDLPKGTTVSVKADAEERQVTLIEPITYQHKFSVVPIKKGDRILKYGQVIGEATAEIRAGEHVHVHNMVGLRLKAAGKA
jgi:altronate dehydratase small subunit